MVPVGRSVRPFVVLLACLLVIASVTPLRAQTDQPRALSATPALPETSQEQLTTKEQLPAGQSLVPATSTGLVSLIVKLDLAALPAYRGGIPGLPATSPAERGTVDVDPDAGESLQYLAHLDQQLDNFEGVMRAMIPRAAVAARYRFVYGGVALLVPADQVDRVAQLPGVLSVQRDRLYQLTTDRSPEFIGAPVLWNALGGQAQAGEGVVVGVIDSGIWPEHPSFADDGSYGPPPPDWRGTCDLPLDDSPPVPCTNKLVGARVFLDAYRRAVGLGEDEYDSPRDDNGHGTHTASTAAGNAGVRATIDGIDRGVISGIAPRARVAAYKACGAIGCAGTDLVAAIDQAVADGVDVINYSISGGEEPFTSPTELAFLDAYAAGVFVAASAGNNGPDAGTVHHAGGWVTTVGASTTDRYFASTLTLQGGADTLVLEGASITEGIATPTPVTQYAADPLCLRPFPAGSVAGKIVACQRGVNGRVAKGYNVLQGGAVGMILYNPALADVESDNHWLPTVHLADGRPFLEFLSAHPDVVATFTTGAPREAPGDVLAAFSARGPTVDNGLIKPDLTAPGVQILAGHSPGHRPDVTLGPTGELFQSMAGTSMSSPHVAGAGALLRALHPDWTPGQVKSALMTTARGGVVREDGSTPATPLDAGSGRVDLARAGEPGLTFDVTAEQYRSNATHQWDLNYPSVLLPSMPGRFTVTRTAKSTLDRETTWTAVPHAPPGVGITVTPAEIVVPARGYASFTITIDAPGVMEGLIFGSVELRHRDLQIHLPVAFEREQPSVSLAKSCEPATIRRGETTTCTVTVENSSLDPATVSVWDQLPPGLELRARDAVGGELDLRSDTVSFNGHLPGATPELITVEEAASPFGYLPLSRLGIAPLRGFCASCDDASISFNVDPFRYGGEEYTRVTMVSNGYVIVGGGSSLTFRNQRFPDPAQPNNVIAPYWTDLDLDGDSASDAGGGTWSAAFVTDHVSTWFVAEWTDVAEFGREDSAHSFQVWLTLGGDRAYMTYGPTTAPPPRLTVGAENLTGSAGVNRYVDLTTGAADGEGTPPVEGTELLVTGTPRLPTTHVMRFVVEGDRVGQYQNVAELTSNVFLGTNLAAAPITVTRR